MEDTLKELIVKCVTKGVTFEGKLGTNYTIQDLFHTVNSLTTINNMWKKVKAELSALDNDTLFDTKNTTKESALKLKVDTLDLVFKYKKEQIEKAKNREAIKAEKAEKLSHLKGILSKKQYEAMESMSLEDLQKEVASLEEEG